MEELWGAPNRPRDHAQPRAPFWASGLQKFEDICLDNKAVVDSLDQACRRFSALLVSDSRVRIATKEFLRFYFLVFIPHISFQNEKLGCVSIPNEAETPPCARGPPTLWVLVSPFCARDVAPRTCFTSWEIFGGLGVGWMGESLQQKHIPARGFICSIKPKPECRENVFAHNTGLIGLNQRACICISTQDYFNPTWFLKHIPNCHRSFYFNGQRASLT